MVFRRAALALTTAALFAALASVDGARQDRVFEDAFERGSAQWEIVGPTAIRVEPSGDPRHGGVLVLEPNGDVYALARGSEAWDAARIDGEAMFPTDEDNYLGVIYNFQRRGARTDFGLIYIKGNGNYVQVNPHRDFNVGRTLYPEGRAALTGASAFRQGEWQRFRLEKQGRVCHFYVGDLETPVLTFADFEFGAGSIGLQPRSVGGPVWVDNVTVERLTRLTYQGPAIPAGVVYEPSRLLTGWQVAGPFTETRDDIAVRPDEGADLWRPFATDSRGAVVTARVVDYHGPRTVAYFRTTVPAERPGPATLWLSSVDDVAVWINGRFEGFASREPFAWFDLATNPAHQGRSASLSLVAGDNDIVIRVRGGVYATGGFFARIER